MNKHELVNLLGLRPIFQVKINSSFCIIFPVLSRYDMTLTEYTESVKCPSQRVAMVIIAQLLEGVSHLTANGIAHRDLKGNNILVNMDPGKKKRSLETIKHKMVVVLKFDCLTDQIDLSLFIYSESNQLKIYFYN